MPLSIELGRTPEEVQILRIVANATEVGKMTLAPPGVPADRVQALRRAFDADDQGPGLPRRDEQAAPGDHPADR